MDGPTSRATATPTRMIAALALSLVWTGAGCTAQPSAPTVERSASTGGHLKQGTGTVRHDLEPLTRRFTALGTPVSATWMSGSLKGDAPGPSTSWIDAVVEVTPETARSLAELAPTATTSTLEAERPVLDAVPEGKSKTAAALEAAFAQDSFRARVELVEGTNTVVLVSLGE